jgi:hypothetical protein
MPATITGTGATNEPLTDHQNHQAHRSDQQNRIGWDRNHLNGLLLLVRFTGDPDSNALANAKPAKLKGPLQKM